MDCENYNLQAELENKHWWYVARRAILSQLVASLSLPPNAEILDLGCGAGGNIEIFSPLGKTYGMEVDLSSRVRALEQGYVEVEPGSLPQQIPFGGRQFDLVAMLDVLEHIEEDEATLSALNGKLKPGSWLLLTVPACQCLWSHSDVVAHHKRRYPLKSLRTVISRAGYQEIYISYFNFWLFPLIAGIRLLKNITGSKAIDLSMPSPWINRMLTAIFSSESIFIGKRMRLPLGVSLVMLAQKR